MWNMEGQIEYKIVTGPQAKRVVAEIISSSTSFAGNTSPVDAFVNFTQRYAIDLSRQPIAEVSGKGIASCLLMVNPGATASVMVPEGFAGGREEIFINLLKLVAENIGKWNLALIQSMLAENADMLDKIFQSAGFEKLCSLDIMEAPVRIPRKPDSLGRIQWESYEKNSDERFANLIVASYEKSLDCPELTGLRTGGEIFEGHRYSGIFEPEGWFVLRYEDRDAGLFLLNSTEEDPERIELIYMGLAPWARGKGLGEVVMREAMRAASNLHKKIIRLAVDERNGYARRLYEKFGFGTIRKQSVRAILNRGRITDRR